MGAGESTPVVETVPENNVDINIVSDMTEVSNGSKTMTQDEVMNAMENVVSHEYSRMQEQLSVSSQQHLAEAQQMVNIIWFLVYISIYIVVTVIIYTLYMLEYVSYRI